MNYFKKIKEKRKGKKNVDAKESVNKTNPALIWRRNRWIKGKTVMGLGPKSDYTT